MRGYFIDIQGTILSDVDKSPIKGSIEFLQTLQKNDIPYILVTNNTKQMSEDLQNELRKKGFEFKHFLDPLMVLKDLIQNQSVYPFGAKEFKEVLPKMGFNIELKNPQNILIASSHTFSNADYAQMIEFCLNGANLVAMHATSTYMKNNTRFPGVGSISKMIEYATAKKAQIVGKPSKNLYETALNYLQKQNPDLTFSDITMISDDAIGDLCGAKDLGMRTNLVLSGKCKNSNEIENFKEKIDEIYENIGEINPS